jgi:hypothetical protein
MDIRQPASSAGDFVKDMGPVHWKTVFPEASGCTSLQIWWQIQFMKECGLYLLVFTWNVKGKGMYAQKLHLIFQGREPGVFKKPKEHLRDPLQICKGMLGHDCWVTSNRFTGSG